MIKNGIGKIVPITIVTAMIVAQSGYSLSSIHFFDSVHVVVFI